MPHSELTIRLSQSNGHFTVAATSSLRGPGHSLTGFEVDARDATVARRLVTERARELGISGNLLFVAAKGANAHARAPHH
jgi:hypothetical protein